MHQIAWHHGTWPTAAVRRAFLFRPPYLAALRDGAWRCYWNNAGATLGVLLLDTSGAGTASVDRDSEEKSTRKTTMLQSAH